MFCSSLPPDVCRSTHVFYRYLCLFAHICSGVQHILLCVFDLFFLRLVYPMLSVSLDCLFLIAPSVFSNVYLSCVPYVASFSGLSIFDCPFGIL
jgi:hypothetical protein